MNLTYVSDGEPVRSAKIISCCDLVPEVTNGYVSFGWTVSRHNLRISVMFSLNRNFLQMSVWYWVRYAQYLLPILKLWFSCLPCCCLTVPKFRLWLRLHFFPMPLLVKRGERSSTTLIQEKKNVKRDDPGFLNEPRTAQIDAKHGKEIKSLMGTRSIFRGVSADQSGSSVLTANIISLNLSAASFCLRDRNRSLTCFTQTACKASTKSRVRLYRRHGWTASRHKESCSFLWIQYNAPVGNAALQSRCLKCQSSEFTALSKASYTLWFSFS